MKKFCLVSIVFLFVSCGYMGGVVEGDKSSCNLRVDRGFAVKWRELPVPVYIHEAAPELARKNFIYSMDMLNEAWNYYSGKGRLYEFVGVIPLDKIPSKKNADGINIVFFDRKHKILTPLQQGATRLRNYFMGSMYEGDIVINNIHFMYYYETEPFDYSVYTKVPELSTKRSFASTSPESFWKEFLYAFQAAFDFLAFWRKKHFRDLVSEKPEIPSTHVDAISLFEHELLHLVGMLHINDTRSLLYPDLRKSQIRREITEIELSKLACAYGKE